MSLQGFSDKPICDDWDYDVYSSILSQITGISIEIVQPVKGNAYTWQLDDKGEPLFIDVKS